jgi:DNA-binding response OmpR family regulator
LVPAHTSNSAFLQRFIDLLDMTTILIIEDAVDLACGIARELQINGYTVRLAHDGLAGWAEFQSSSPDLLILDWMLPGLDGLEILRRIRQVSAVPVLMLTARGEEADRVIGLELGADDYLIKPFGLRELVARVRALLRRAERLQEMFVADHAAAGSGPVLSWNGLTLDPMSYQASIQGAALDLTHTEFELLHLMMRNPGRTFTRRYLLETIWGETYLGGDRSVDNAVLRLRKKLSDLGDSIETVRSVGYRWRR